MDAALTVSLFLAALTSLAFTALYMIRAKWWKSAFGVATVVTSFVFTILFLRLALLYAVPNLKDDLKVTGLVVYVLAIGSNIHRIVLLQKVQRIRGQGQVNSNDH